MAGKEEWVSLFEKVIGRKPTSEEFMKAKEGNFDPSKIMEIAGYQKEQEIPEASKSITVPLEETSGQLPKATSGISSQIPSPQAVKTNQGLASRLDLVAILVALSLLFSLVILLAAWLTPLALTFLVLSILNLVFAGLVLFLSLKKPNQVLAIIATIVSALVLLSSLGALIFQNAQESQKQTDSPKTSQEDKKEVSDASDDEKSKEDTSDSDGKADSTDVNDYIDKSAKFDWTEKDFTDLTFSGYDNNNGTPLKDIIKDHGKASDAEISGNDMTLTYESGSGLNGKEVRLRFEKQYDNSFILYSGSAYGLSDAPKRNPNYQANWSKEDYDKLTEGDMDTGQGGNKWTDIQKQHGDPSDAYVSLANYGDGVSKTLMVTYSDYDSDDSKLTYVSLDFVENDGTYYLINKYSDQDD
ncbi:ABC transporter permease [Streptococcus hyovaginalis]|uniref:ABC transporter permease n=1 Tax=Streptococcus hyovaginalis TaxID=149015 RepID=UPI002A7EBB7D|nr:hypothetical protein [Streptococcus hyovaginalis]MDY4510858.1 hypothetical protein [Streptococcus hyovaginalis]